MSASTNLSAGNRNEGTVARRSRMRRTPLGKRLALTARDIEIFRRLAQYRYLPSTYLHVFAGGASETRFKERLGDLFHEGFIDRPAQQWQFAQARYAPVIYELGERASRVLAECENIDGATRTFLAHSGHRQFEHSLTICQLLASVELAAKARSNLRFIPWPEILARAPEAAKTATIPFRIPVPSGGAVVPDAIFGLEYGSQEKRAYRFFALEVDRGTMPAVRTSGKHTSYLGKLALYRDLISQQVYRSHFGVPNLFVLTVTMNRAHLETILHALGGQNGDGARFLFKAMSGGTRALTVPALSILFEPWERSGLLPLKIDE